MQKGSRPVWEQEDSEDRGSSSRNMVNPGNYLKTGAGENVLAKKTHWICALGSTKCAYIFKLLERRNFD